MNLKPPHKEILYICILVAFFSIVSILGFSATFFAILGGSYARHLIGSDLLLLNP